MRWDEFCEHAYHKWICKKANKGLNAPNCPELRLEVQRTIPSGVSNGFSDGDKAAIFRGEQEHPFFSLPVFGQQIHTKRVVIESAFEIANCRL